MSRNSKRNSIQEWQAYEFIEQLDAKNLMENSRKYKEMGINQNESVGQS